MLILPTSLFGLNIKREREKKVFRNELSSEFLYEQYARMIEYMVMVTHMQRLKPPLGGCNLF